jgi:hypothetical protein
MYVFRILDVTDDFRVPIFYVEPLSSFSTPCIHSFHSSNSVFVSSISLVAPVPALKWSLNQTYVGNCPLSEVYLIYTTFRELALLPCLGNCLSCHWHFIIINWPFGCWCSTLKWRIELQTTVGIEPGTFRMLGLYANHQTIGILGEMKTKHVSNVRVSQTMDCRTQ